jgi:hypothetical protein
VEFFGISCNIHIIMHGMENVICLMNVYVAKSLIYTRVYLQRNAADHCPSLVSFFAVNEISLNWIEFYFVKNKSKAYRCTQTCVLNLMWF